MSFQVTMRLIKVIQLSLILIALNLFGGRGSSDTSINGVSALIAQKARVCFNSMSSTFQSECVYCDTKLYASTMTACTGFPTLGNNVTQAQAFCIATACLQVPVSTSADSASMKANERPDLARMISKQTNLSRDSLLHATARKHDLFEGVGVEWQDARLGSPELGLLISDTQKASDGSTSGQPTPFSASDIPAPTAPPIAPSPVSTMAVPTVMLPEESQINSYPDFNQMHAQIHADSMRRLSLVSKRPSLLPLKLSWSYPADRAPLGAGLMRTISTNLATKRANWRQLLQFGGRGYKAQQVPMALARSQTGKSPVVLGRRRKRRSLVKPLSFTLNKNKQRLQANGTVTAQLNKSVNGTTSGNVNFVLNNPKKAYLWSNPLTRVITMNSPNKSLQWQFGKGRGQVATAPTAAASAGGQPARPVGANQAAVSSGTGGGLQTSPDQQPLTASFVVPAGRANASG